MKQYIKASKTLEQVVRVESPLLEISKVIFTSDLTLKLDLLGADLQSLL